MKKLLLALVAFFALSFGAFAAVNLNTATKEELDTVKGIGPVKAQAIIDYRKAHGPFNSVDELKNVRGFGEKSVAKMRSELSVSGATTVRAEPEKSEGRQSGKAESRKEGKGDRGAAPGEAQAPEKQGEMKKEEVKKWEKGGAGHENKAGKKEKKDKQSKKDKKKAKKDKKKGKQDKDGKQEQK